MMICKEFLDIRILDIIDIFLVAILIYFLYRLLKGTIAFYIFIGLISIYFIWLLVQSFEMSLLSTILGQFIGVGVLALLIVFQQEIRRFLLIIGQNNIFVKKGFSIKYFLPWNWKLQKGINLNYEEIVRACKRMSQSKTGALIALAKTSVLQSYQRTGVIIDAVVSSLLLQNIFIKSSPLHDGAVIISNNRISAASCIFPVSENQDLPQHLGLRHRAALGMSEISDAIIIVVSEENGHISYFSEGRMLYNISPERMRILLEKTFITTELQ